MKIDLKKIPRYGDWEKELFIGQKDKLCEKTKGKRKKIYVVKEKRDNECREKVKEKGIGKYKRRINIRKKKG